MFFDFNRAQSDKDGVKLLSVKTTSPETARHVHEEPYQGIYQLDLAVQESLKIGNVPVAKQFGSQCRSRWMPLEAGEEAES
ncbi:hypothetical protein WISP_85296 [Willisornis vidua]|uniref:Uncharacterized protein n=1 Tax=Willisornis vidua TaxID=1566151 RepID=A0ABQ9D7Z6_9PASS|nr:hypothetical protein WISP_85296 [Willisornis vidua]